MKNKTMKRKSILFICFAIILIAVLIWNYGLLNQFNYLSARKDIADNTPHKVLVGESIISSAEINSVSKKYGFENISLGCMVNGAELNGIEIHNSLIDEHLNKINEVGWRLNYQNEIDSLLKSEEIDFNDKSNLQTEGNYEKNLKIASKFYLLNENIPDEVLLNLIPENQNEFTIYYNTTSPNHELCKSNFFYDTSELIFEKVTSEKNEHFYLPSLRLISFADGEFAEGFIEYLEKIIALDIRKFCSSIKNKNYVTSNPIKAYSEINQCDK